MLPEPRAKRSSCGSSRRDCSPRDSCAQALRPRGAASGHGEAIYQIGVEDDGTVRGITQEQLDASIETLKLIAAEIDADATLIRERDGLSCALTLHPKSRW